MATRTPSFAPIPSVPQVGLQPWQWSFYNAIKENVELLTGSRNGTSEGNRAVTTDMITVKPAPDQKMQRVTAEGASYKIQEVVVPSVDDYSKLITNVQTLANDVAAIQQTLNVLIQQLKARP